MTPKYLIIMLTLGLLGGGTALSASAQESDGMTPGAAIIEAAPQTGSPAVTPNVVVPASSKAEPADAGIRAHTNFVIHNPKGIQPHTLTDLSQAEPEDNPTPNATYAEYPASLACIYKMGPAYAGCVPMNNYLYNATGGSRAIAIVDAYDNPNAEADLAYFNSFFGLKALPSNPLPGKFGFKKVIANGNGHCTVPPYNIGWALESALDIQWAHAMAPSAAIILVEACSNSYDDLMYAVQIAQQQLLLYGGGQVSLSWGSNEFPGEVNLDYIFRLNWQPGKTISYFVSAGDSGLGAQYPSSSPWVVSAGGTTINRDPTTQYFVSESCWAGSGGGISTYETYSSSFGTGTGPWTNFQYPLFGQSNRRTPDISFDADPASGAWVRFNSGWYVVGGTSLSAPALAGIVNNANNRLGVAPSPGGYYTNAENNLLYAELLAINKEYKSNFYDVKTGSNGASAGTGWDYCTGVGSPRGKNGK